MRPKHDLGSYATKQPVRFAKYQTFPYTSELDTHIQLGLIGEPMANNECLLNNRGFTLLNFDPSNLMLVGQVWVDLSQFSDVRLDLWCKEFPETECTHYMLSTKLNTLTIKDGDFYLTIDNSHHMLGLQFFTNGQPTVKQQKILEQLGWK